MLFSLWQDPKKRSYLYQILAVFVTAAVLYSLYKNAVLNLERQNIASGFGFLTQEAGFEISETVFSFEGHETYTKALLAGVANTLKVAIFGNLLAVLLGTLVGISRLSPNWLLAKLSHTYVEVLRNIPLLLQLFFWYALFTEILPNVKTAHELFPHIYLSQRGLVFPAPGEHSIWGAMGIAFLVGLVSLVVIHFLLQSRREKTGKETPLWPFALVLLMGFPLLAFVFGKGSLALDIPRLDGFNFKGGSTLSPEFTSLLLGLVLYTSAFIAEIVRAGILSVKKGQWEAGRALGLKRSQVMGLVVLPQALRVIIPPLTGQILNLTKNSSLAVGIGYPDFVSVANTTMNQTGQAIEAVLLIMGVYLFFSLTTSLFMNIYNKAVALRGR